jgi:hypothetical protein
MSNEKETIIWMRYDYSLERKEETQMMSAMVAYEYVSSINKLTN